MKLFTAVAAVLLQASHLPAWAAETTFPKPFSDSYISDLRSFHYNSKRLLRLKESKLKVSQHVTRKKGNEWIELGPREWGEIHKEALAEIQAKANVIFEKHSSELQNLLIDDVSYRVIFCEPGDIKSPKDAAIPRLVQTEKTNVPYVHLDTVVLLEKGQYQIFYPPQETLELLLTDTLKFVRETSGKTEKAEMDRLVRLGVEQKLLKPLQSFHRLLKRGKSPALKRTVFTYRSEWERLPEEEWGKVHHEVHAELEKQWNAFLDKAKDHLQTLAIDTVYLQCQHANNPKTPESVLNFASVSIPENGAIAIDAFVVRTGETYSFRYPALDERLLAFLTEQANRVKGVETSSEREKKEALADEAELKK